MVFVKKPKRISADSGEEEATSRHRRHQVIRKQEKNEIEATDTAVMLQPTSRCAENAVAIVSCVPTRLESQTRTVSNQQGTSISNSNNNTTAMIDLLMSQINHTDRAEVASILRSDVPANATGPAAVPAADEDDERQRHSNNSQNDGDVVSTVASATTCGGGGDAVSTVQYAALSLARAWLPRDMLDDLHKLASAAEASAPTGAAAAAAAASGSVAAEYLGEQQPEQVVERGPRTPQPPSGASPVPNPRNNGHSS